MNNSNKSVHNPCPYGNDECPKCNPRSSDTNELRRFIIQEITHMVAKGIKTGVFEDWTVGCEVANKVESLIATKEAEAYQKGAEALWRSINSAPKDSWYGTAVEFLDQLKGNR